MDDGLYAAFGKFKEGVRILVFSDSCHSGTVAKLAYYRRTAISRVTRYRNMPPDQMPNYFQAGKADKKFEAQRPFTL